ncbi:MULTISPECIES: AimR family lysis-lysogeny pheromone receptor [Pontibacillus]|uniref:AimR family lysis-lysogeny pheromone receptor n=1 Tax=Pontibacillus chungwhensis TaxID=265426 RepID=A0ABY8V1H2_9BACI|nr:MULTISPECIES: AimR family lysis-lysogeny pheromone receptor [Pontibacillus]MCD5325481.1 AimR family lysis-lysogeny pheromone receptor [Pontibacillus sp. HN14]WIF98594.1 AimR family lysis-lysogeny pheromone receptor [Pontibacillus chungwhensis]
MRNEETGPVCSSEQLESVRQLVGPDEPALFTVLQQLTKEYDEITTIQLTKEFCFHCQTDENKRVGLEYLYMNGLLDEVQELVKINEESANQINREWAYLYQFFLDRKLRNAEIDDFEAFFSRFQTSDPELECLIIFTKIYVHCDKFDFKVIDNYRGILTKQLLKINNTLLRIYFQLRENEMLFVHHFKRNDIEAARNYGRNLIENSLINYAKKCYVTANLAETYVFDDFEKAKVYIKEAKDIAIKYDLSYFLGVINNRIVPFMHAVNNDCDGIETNDIPEAAHLEAVKGNAEEAVRLLNSLEELTPYQEYYLGLATGDEKVLYNSYQRLLKEKKDFFFSKLPLRELQKRGWNSIEEENANAH